MFWDFDRILIGEVKDNATTLRKISEGAIGNVKFVSTSKDLISIVGFYPVRDTSGYSLLLTDINLNKIIKLIERERKFNCEVQHLGEQEGICYPKWPCQNTMFTLPKQSVSL